MKKFRIIIFSLLVVTLVPISTFASTDGPQYASGWQTILDVNYTLYNNDTKYSRTVLSGGGNARICVTGVNAGNTVSLALWSDDPTIDDHIFTVSHSYFAPSGEDTKYCSGPINVEPAQDGTYAELYLRMKSLTDYSDYVNVEIHD